MRFLCSYLAVSQVLALHKVLHKVTYCNTPGRKCPWGWDDSWMFGLTHCNILQHNATRRNTHRCSWVWDYRGCFPPSIGILSSRVATDPLVCAFLAVCCAVLRCVALRCTVLHCDALFRGSGPTRMCLCCCVLLCHTARYCVMHCEALLCTVLWLRTHWCVSLLQYVAV